VICTAYSDYSWGDIRTKLGSSDNLLILKKPFDNIEVIQLAHALTRKWLLSRQAHIKLDDLDAVVALRTQELRRANEALTHEFSDRMKAEEAFRVMFEASPIAIALLDQDLVFVDANASMQRLHAKSHEELLTMSLADLHWFSSEDEAQQTFSMGPKATIDQREIAIQSGARNRKTALLWARHAEVHGIPRIICFVLDITERKLMEMKLREARIEAEHAARAKSEFLANMSHEIRTPLHGILGLCTVLNDETLPENLQTMARLVHTSGEVLHRIVDDILDFSKNRVRQAGIGEGDLRR
jgi:two-component system, cell cycle sensor histidine kinase and response regulator CckA